MSLTNPNKPVTEARLQEFYHRIKSYLGFTEMPSEDMSEVISPLPSVQPRYHKYSTEEHIVGEWIDGKTLYEKTIELNITTSTNQGANIYTGEISISTFFDFSTIDNVFFDIEHSFYVLGNVRGFVYGWVVKEASTVLIGTLYARSNVPSKLTIQYTKSE